MQHLERNKYLRDIKLILKKNSIRHINNVKIHCIDSFDYRDKKCPGYAIFAEFVIPDWNVIIIIKDLSQLEITVLKLHLITMMRTDDEPDVWILENSEKGFNDLKTMINSYNENINKS